MTEQEEMHRKFRDLYTSDFKANSITKGQEIERMTNSFLRDLASPFKQNLNVRIGRNEFDGEIVIGRGKTILYEIYVGSLSKFRYERILELVETTRYLRRTYYLFIAQSFSGEDRNLIGELASKLPTKKARMCFIDYETLVSLHKFVLDIPVENNKDVRTIKGLFLEKLFEGEPILSESYLSSALSKAKRQYKVESQEGKWQQHAAYAPSVLIKKAINEERIQKLEEMAERLLHEIRLLREELQGR